MRARADLSEGSEVLVGSAFLLIFSEDAATASRYATGQALDRRSRRGECAWEGMVLKARKGAACPQCQKVALVEVDGCSGEARRALGPSERPSGRLQTAAMDPDLAKKILRTIKAAKGSHIVRVDADGSPLRTELTEDGPVELARSSDPGLRLGGLAFGRVTVAWDGAALPRDQRDDLPRDEDQRREGPGRVVVFGRCHRDRLQRVQVPIRVSRRARTGGETSSDANRQTPRIPRRPL